MRRRLEMTEHHFVFVHGAGHGGWCWYKLTNSLRENGHKATCIDLKGAGINPTDPNTVSSLDDYDEPLYAFLSQLPIDQKVILVSHSVGGAREHDCCHVPLSFQSFLGRLRRSCHGQTWYLDSRKTQKCNEDMFRIDRGGN